MAAPARPEEALLAEALDNIDDDAAFLPLALSALTPSGRSALPSARAPAPAGASELFWPHTAAARALSLMKFGTSYHRRQARQYVRHTREGTEVACALRLGPGNDRIEWTHSILSKLKNPFRKQVKCYFMECTVKSLRFAHVVLV
jgi:hypothetical protein